MRPRWLPAAVALAVIAGRGIPAPAGPDRPAASPRSIDDCEADPPAWKFVGGEEFPGAKGSMARDPGQHAGGRASLRLDADFRGGGAYVGVWKDLEPLKLPDGDGFRLMVRASNLRRLGVRVVDRSGQCHQSSVALPAGSGDGWRELTLRLADLVGGEHWDGANDGAWHGPARGLGLNVGRDAVGPDPAGRATLWVDDLALVPIAAGTPTLRAASVEVASCRPGFGTRVRYAWDAEPLGADCSVFVHLVDAQGRMAFQADHDPPAPTARWSGPVEYARTIVVPTDAKPGRYDVVVGLWDRRPAAEGGGRRPFRVGPGLEARPGDACRVGSVEVAEDAPLPTLPAPTLDLSRYRLTFDEDFNGPLSVSAWGPGTRWIAHTPYAGDFGDAGFGDPGKDSPFEVRDGILQLSARKVGGRWRSGLLSSVDPQGRGFSQKYGYFEMRAKLPKGLGTWPAFWLMGGPQLVEPKDRKTIPQVEVDVVEQYGVGPNALHTTLHTWGPGDLHWAEGDVAVVAGMTDDFHAYGVAVEEDFITFYFDGSAIRRSPTPKDARVPLYLMVDLALGGGWPIDRTPDPSVILVDHIRAYARR